MQKTNGKIGQKDSGRGAPAQHESKLLDNRECADKQHDNPGNPLPAVCKTKEIKKIKEITGPKGLEPTRDGDWESKGRCFDF